jgi:predicted phosphodiesterase
MKTIKGVFLSDVHLPYEIDLSPILQYLKDLQPDQIILGGDIIDADGTFGIDGWTADQVEKMGFKLYDRDVALLTSLLEKIHKAAPRAKVVFLEGNHEQRYRRPKARYPELLKDRFNLERDGIPDAVKKNFTWIPYGDYDSFHKVGDMLFTHGTIYPDAHAKKMAMAYLPNKIVYGHIHDFQSYTTHNGDPRKPGRYAVTAGCLCGRIPDYKKGQPNKWVNGFISWASVGGGTTATPILVENWGFMVGKTLYKSGDANRVL